MNKNTKIILALIVTLLAVGAFVYFINSMTPVEEMNNVDNTNTVAGDTLLGCYVAHLANDVYTLKIDSNQGGAISGMLAYNNYEKDSSSGSFNGTYTDGILTGNYSFDSEGMHSDRQVIFKKEGQNFVQGFGPVSVVGGKETFDNVSEVNFDPNSKFTKNANCVEKFTEVNNKFTFAYNPLFHAFERNQEANLPDTDWRQNAKEKGMLLAQVSIPRAYMPGTNFSGAVLTVGASTEPEAIKSCTANAGNGEASLGTEAVSGYSFSKFTASDAGAGNFYETMSYRGLLDGDCYALEYTVHYTNIGNYSPDQGIKEFDKTKIQKELEQIIQSFKFLVNSD